MRNENNFDRIVNSVNPCGTMLSWGVTPRNLKEGFFSTLKGYMFDFVKSKWSRHSEGANAPEESICHCEKIKNFPLLHKEREEQSSASLRAERVQGEVIALKEEEHKISPHPQPFSLMRRRDQKVAFTLAEVLITLSILGVIAAVSIPNIIQHYQKRVTITKLQKAYATLEKVATNIMFNSGCVNSDLSCTGLLDDDFSQDKFINLSDMKYKKKLNLSNVGFMRISEKKLYTSYVDKLILTSDDIGYFVYKGTTKADGKIYSSIIIFVFTEPKDIMKNTSLPRFDDIHYSSTKTIAGRNVFLFGIYDNFKVEPLLDVNGGGEGHTRPLSEISSSNAITYCDPETTNTDVKYSGTACTKRIIQDGWKINY